MEQISGQDLKGFFKQWLNTAGHPDIAVSWKYDTKTHIVDLKVDQKQKNLYVFPLEVAIDGKMYTVNMTASSAIMHIAAGKKTPVIEVDPNVNLLASFTVEGN